MNKAKIKPLKVSHQHFNLLEQGGSGGVRRSSLVPFVSLISGMFQIIRFIRGGHALPDSLSFRVSPFVVKLGRDDENDVVRGERQKNFVSRAVQGFVLVTINLSSVIC